MSYFDDARRDMSELLRLVRQSERYLTSTAADPSLASESTHAAEIQREHRIIELSARLGVSE